MRFKVGNIIISDRSKKLFKVLKVEYDSYTLSYSPFHDYSTIRLKTFYVERDFYIFDNQRKEKLERLLK